MPTIVHKCKKCGKVFEVIHSFSEEKYKADCPDCKEEAERVWADLGDVAVHYKGTGWCRPSGPL